MSIPNIASRAPNTPITPSTTPVVAMRPKQQQVAPALASRPAPITKIITSKEWVLPPRPKPGRKPSADTPATKRKAQNRAAQRAFRERRANRVSELETQILELEREKSIKEGILTNTVKGLQKENDSLKKSMADMKAMMEQIQRQLNSQQQQQQQLSRSSSQASTPKSVQQSQFRTVQPMQKRRRNTSSVSPTSTGGSNPPTPQSQSHSDELTEAASMMINFKNNSRAGSLSAATSPLSFPSTQTPRSQQSSSSNHRRSSSFSYPQLSPVAQVPTLKPIASNNTPAQSPAPVQAVKSEAQTSNDDDDSCGICTKDECICETLGLKEKTTPMPTLKDAFSFEDFKPLAAVPLRKRSRAKEQGEVDFTNKFKKFKSLPRFKRDSNTSTTSSLEVENNGNDMLFKSPSMSLSLNDESEPTIIRTGASISGATDTGKGDNFESVISPEDQCGFCSDDTPCVCREIAKQKEMLQQKDNMLTNQINEAPASAIVEEEEAEEVEAEKEKLEQISQCTGNPGTCRQCQTDPMSTLFCTTIASKAENEGSVSKKLPTESSSRSGTITPVESKSNNRSLLSSSSSASVSELLSTKMRNQSPSTNTSNSSMLPTPPDLGANRSNSIILPHPTNLELSNPNKHFIPCADAYKTLSRHHNFPKAGFNSIISNLNTNGMFVEVESVVNCLRELDRKFGSN
ncbi:unnamed protein product [Ambrosiozyma monospora]|uniref:Unnamed protein product n=1 Tax=Ambrosiozyma monospora TaxID=43982 RepID=A0ACB5SXU8_AMBMO|nr:unnamed protein product [Ambrosiozyma monospora]